MVIYRHVVTVVILTPECSPDTVIDRLCAPFEGGGPAERAEGSVTAQARAATPYMRVADPPHPYYDTTDSRACHEYYQARDSWQEGLPTLGTFREDGRA